MFQNPLHVIFVVGGANVAHRLGILARELVPSIASHMSPAIRYSPYFGEIGEVRKFEEGL